MLCAAGPKAADPKKNTAELNTHVNPDAAGIDVGAEELVAAVPGGRCEGACVRTFSSFTDGLLALRDWLPCLSHPHRGHGVHRQLLA